MTAYEEFQKKLKAKDFYKFARSAFTYMMIRHDHIQKQPSDTSNQDPVILECIEPIAKAVMIQRIISRLDCTRDFKHNYFKFSEDDFMLFVIDVVNQHFTDDVFAYALDILSTIFALIENCFTKTKLDLFHVGAECFTEMLSRHEIVFHANGGWKGLREAVAPYEKAYESLESLISRRIQWMKLSKFIDLLAKDKKEKEDMYNIIELITEGQEPMNVYSFEKILPVLKLYAKNLPDINSSSEEEHSSSSELSDFEECKSELSAESSDEFSYEGAEKIEIFSFQSGIQSLIQPPTTVEKTSRSHIQQVISDSSYTNTHKNKSDVNQLNAQVNSAHFH